MDALLVTLTQLKQGSTYNTLAKAFGCPGSTMRHLATNIITLCSKDVFKHFLPTNQRCNQQASQAIGEGQWRSKRKDTMSVDTLEEQYQWGALLDKGYIGAQKFGQFIVPSKRKPKKTLGPADIRRNAKIEHDRVIIDNYFGRMKKLWGYMDLHFQLDQKNTMPSSSSVLV